jgi:ATP-dependent Clp protease adapter protein ClpS
MWHAHQSGLAVVGLFSFEVAEAKVDTAMKLAAEMDFPMLMTLEPEN